MLERVRERVSYLPARTQGRIVAAITIVVTAGAFALDDVLTGFAHKVYWAVTFMLFGATVTLIVMQRRR